MPRKGSGGELTNASAYDVESTPVTPDGDSMADDTANAEKVLLVDTAGADLVGTTGVKTQGVAASDAAEAGNPVQIGGSVDETSPATAGEGDVRRIRVSPEGNVYTELLEGENVIGQGDTPADNLTQPTTILDVLALPHVFNGTTWDRLRSPGTATPLLGVVGVNHIYGVSQQTDDSANDVDKTFTVPANRQWHILYCYIQLATTATVGNRQLRLLCLPTNNGDGILLNFGATQAASLTRHYNMMPNATRETGFTNSSDILVPLPPNLVLGTGGKFRILQTPVIDANDDMTIRMIVDEKVV